MTFNGAERVKASAAEGVDQAGRHEKHLAGRYRVPAD